MATRAIKKLTKKDDLQLLKEKLAKSDEEEGDGTSESDDQQSSRPSNKFQFVSVQSDIVNITVDQGANL